MKTSRLITALAIAACSLAASATIPKVVAHRGYWNTEGSAQNSIRALVKADSIGVHAVELDVWITADDEIVLNHDPQINGVTVETATMDVLGSQKLKNGETIPTLDCYLDTARMLRPELVIEIKPHADKARELPAIEKTIQLVADHGLTDRVTYITFSENAHEHLVRLSGRPVYYLTATAPERLAEMNSTGPDYHISNFRKNPEWVSRFKGMGMPINVWTVNDADGIKYCIDNEVDFITTDQPELALELTKKASEPVQMKVMSFNLRFGELATLEEIAEVIRAYDPDFVALQEVDVCTNRNLAPHQNGHNFINELASLTGMFGQYARTINFAGGYYGIGVLSKHPFASTRKLWLPNPKNLEPRVMLETVAELEGGRHIAFVGTHLAYELPETQALQARFLLDEVAKLDMPVLVAGDLNARPGEEVISMFNAEMKDMSAGDLTWPSEKPEMKIDFIFAAPAERFTLIEALTHNYDGKPVSDHKPIVSTVEVKF